MRLMSPSETAVINVLQTHGALTIKEMAKHASYSKSSMQRAANQLWHDGRLDVRVGASPTVYYLAY